MDPIIKSIFSNIIARKNGRKPKVLKPTSTEILESFFLPVFKPGYVFRYVDYGCVIFNPCSYIEIDHKTLEDALEELRFELQDEQTYEYDYDKHHTINKSMDCWYNQIAERIVDKLDDPKEYDRAYENGEDEDVDAKFIKKLGWKNIITNEDDDLFEREFLDYIEVLMDQKIEIYNKLMKEVNEYRRMVSKL